jgi:hypothetical protein
MKTLSIQVRTSRCNDTCAFCHKSMGRTDGPQLYLEDKASPICRSCGKRHAPPLVALLDLAQTAERIGHVGRHSVSVPLTALLDLAGAAEAYSEAATSQRRRLAS